MEILITEEQLKTILSEASGFTNFREEACKSFTDPSSNQYCKGVYDYLNTLDRLDNKEKWESFFRKLRDAQNKVAQEKEGEYKVVYKDIREYEAIYRQKIRDLQKLINRVSPECDELKRAAAQREINLRERGRKLLLYKKETEDGETINYSLLNRLNTNPSALSILMTEYAIHNEPGKSPEEIVELFFSNPPNFNEIVSFLRDVLIKPGHIRKKIINSIELTKKKGDDNEDEFFNHLDSEGEKYISFRDDFGEVDMLGIDGLIFKDGQYFPLQIKSSETAAKKNLAIWKYNNGGCKCFVSYPKVNRQDNTKEWKYIEKKSKPAVQDTSDISKNSNKKGTFTVQCDSIVPWNKPNSKIWYNYCNGSSKSAEEIPPRYRFVDFIAKGKVVDTVDRELTQILTKPNSKKVSYYGNITYTLYYKMNV